MYETVSGERFSGYRLSRWIEKCVEQCYVALVAVCNDSFRVGLSNACFCTNITNVL